MELAFLVYIGLMLTLLCCVTIDTKISRTRLSREAPFYKHFFLCIPILLFTLLLGYRHNVGIDWIHYKSDLEIYLIGGSSRIYEYAFQYFFFIIKYFNWNYVALFMFIAFFQIVFLLERGKDFGFIFPFMLFFFFTMGNFIYCINIMRQMIALSIIFWGSRYIVQKNIYKWVFTCAFAMLFHKTAIIALPFFFLNRNIFRNQTILITTLISVYFVFNNILFNQLENLLSYVNLLFGRETTVETLVTQERESQVASGSGLFTLAINAYYLFMLFHYKECGEYFKEKGFYLFFNLASIGIVLFPIVSSNILMDRTLYYFGSFAFVVFGFYAYYFIIKKKGIYRIVGLCSIILYFLQFVRSISGGTNKCAPFLFIE